MALRMVCRAISSRCVSAVPRAAATQCSVPSSLLRHAAGSLTRPAWRSEATTLISLRSLNGSTIARSALTDLLQDEIEYEKENYQPPEEVTSGPPEGWQLTETPGDTHLTLTKTHGSENLQVDLMVNDQPVDPGEVYQDMAGENDEVDVDVGVAFNASVVKGEQSLVYNSTVSTFFANMGGLQFECKSDGTYLDIQHVSLELTNEDPEASTYTGPVYADLDEKLLQEFPAYLDERGINAEMGAYLVGLVNDKEEREYRGWLSNVQKFLKK